MPELSPPAWPSACSVSACAQVCLTACCVLSSVAAACCCILTLQCHCHSQLKPLPALSYQAVLLPCPCFSRLALARSYSDRSCWRDSGPCGIRRFARFVPRPVWWQSRPHAAISNPCASTSCFACLNPRATFPPRHCAAHGLRLRARHVLRRREGHGGWTKTGFLSPAPPGPAGCVCGRKPNSRQGQRSSGARLRASFPKQLREDTPVPKLVEWGRQGDMRGRKRARAPAQASAPGEKLRRRMAQRARVHKKCAAGREEHHQCC